MHKSSQLVKTVREFNQKIPEEDRKLIAQFTEEGVDELVQYYNVKYPDRGQIYRVLAPMLLNPGFEESAFQQKLRVNDEVREATTQGVINLRENHPLPLKVMVTFLQQETPESEYLIERGRHSVPLIITDEKIIMLRDDANPLAAETFQAVADNLGFTFIEQKQPALNSKGNKGSIQADHSNCNGIALGILKDLTHDDLRRVSTFENGYVPLAKMLKYSQSKSFVMNSFPELAEEPVKFNDDGSPKITLGDYIENDGRRGARIGDKMDAMRQDMKDSSVEDQWVQRMMQKKNISEKGSRS